MKRFFNLFYTYTFKILLFVLTVVFSWFAGDKLLDIINLYIDDPVSAKNVFVQWSEFDYEESVYLENEIEQTIENVIEYSLKYTPKLTSQKHGSESVDYYLRLTDEDYKETVEYLESLKDVSFAVVNHKSDSIVSNIPDINTKSSGTPIRQLFGNIDKTTLIVLDARNPAFEVGTMTDYVEFVSTCAQNYSFDFDLYISFGEDFIFRHEVSHYENMHNEMKSSAIVKLKELYLFSALCILVVVFAVAVAGQSEVGGKINASAFDRVPYDLQLASYVTVFISIAALYENSMYMLFRSAFADGNYWLGISPEFYATRAIICICVNTCIILGAACTVKKLLKSKNRAENTYIYRLIKALKETKKQFRR